MTDQFYPFCLATVFACIGNDAAGVRRRKPRGRFATVAHAGTVPGHRQAAGDTPDRPIWHADARQMGLRQPVRLRPSERPTA